MSETGFAATSSVGSVTVAAAADVAVTGPDAAVGGVITPNVWSLIDDSQTPSWTDVTVSQDPSWTDIAA